MAPNPCHKTSFAATIASATRRMDRAGPPPAVRRRAAGRLVTNGALWHSGRPIRRAGGPRDFRDLGFLRTREARRAGNRSRACHRARFVTNLRGEGFATRADTPLRLGPRVPAATQHAGRSAMRVAIAGGKRHPHRPRIPRRPQPAHHVGHLPGPPCKRNPRIPQQPRAPQRTLPYVPSARRPATFDPIIRRDAKILLLEG